MTNDLSPNDVDVIHILLKKGCTLDFITHAMVMGREVGIHKDIRAQIDKLIEGKEEDEKR